MFKYIDGFGIRLMIITQSLVAKKNNRLIAIVYVHVATCTHVYVTQGLVTFLHVSSYPQLFTALHNTGILTENYCQASSRYETRVSSGLPLMRECMKRSHELTLDKRRYGMCYFVFKYDRNWDFKNRSKLHDTNI